jgi:DUF971 family protein
MTALPETIENHAAQGVLALHWPDGRSARVMHARLAAIEPVGAYALNLVFSDGHRRGIYPYEMLAALNGGLGQPTLQPA